MDLEAIRTKTELALSSIAALDAGELAAYFKMQGIKGWPKRSQHCPIAKYLQEQTGTDRLAVSGSIVHISGDGQNVGTYVQHPHCSFIANFDAGFYPELQLKE